MQQMSERATHPRHPILSKDPILPRDKGAAPLDFVIAVMAFLAALALGASLVAGRTAQGWQSGLAERVTVQIIPPAGDNPRAGLEAQTRAALAVLKATPGIAHAAPLSDAEINALLEPWIGKEGTVSGIPLPRLIDATLVPGTKVDFTALSAALKQAAPQSVLDDHRRWIARLENAADAVRWSTYAILLLIAGATAAAVSFATRAGLAAHHDVVALLHQMGALPAFIARAVEWHYFTSTLMAAALGTLAAALVFAGAGGLENFGVEAVSFLPPLSLKWTEIPWLLLVPAASALIAWATARISVLSVVKAIY
jgi:cell division transport system permease protein